MESSYIPPSFTRADLERGRMAELKDTKSVVERCRAIASDALRPYRIDLPPNDALELYLVLALSEITTGGRKTMTVPFPPEFLFILDAGFESLIGVSVFWSPSGYGDPTFPDFSTAKLRSVRSRAPRQLIFPDIPGSLIIGIKPGMPIEEVKQRLEEAGLRQIDVFDYFATASCQPFNELSICSHIETSFAFIKYAAPNSVQRLIDFSPGWSVQHLI